MTRASTMQRLVNDMAAEYSRITTQTVTLNNNVLFTNGNRCCKKGLISHRDDSGIFTLKGSSNGCKAIYKVNFDGNIAIATDGTVEPILIALTLNGETLGNATATATPSAIGDFSNVSITTFIDIPYGCCVTVSVKNVSTTTAIDVSNANIIFERIA